MTGSLVRPSRDGDQFHYLWAARRCLQLLLPNSELVAVAIEGASRTESGYGPTSTVAEELIDIAEYYGSEEIALAKCVRYMQLKHSTCTPDDHWTASGLKDTITGFSDRYKALLKSHSRELLAMKLEFWFVTNRPVSRNFAESVVDAAKGTAPRHPKELAKLEGFVGLSGKDLAAFAELFHFEDRQDDYWDQRNILQQDVNAYLPDADVDSPMQLEELVTRKALTESEHDPAITKMDVLRALKTEEDRLFPARNLIESPRQLVQREQEAELIRNIIDAGVHPVVIHADGGVGKSAFATRVGRDFPDGSVTVLYDCFGNGQYRSATGYRHRHKDALVQITNELAGRGLCHPLIPSPHADTSSYMRAFVYRLTQAIAVIRANNPDAILCLVVDAADNAQMAAEEIGEQRSFARDLIREKIPDGIRFVFLCRSHRQDKLDPPVGTVKVLLRPFSRSETASYLRKTFPEAGDHDVDEFQRLSSQNPRIQAIALSQGRPLPETLRQLGPNPTTVESAIGGLLDDAISKLRDAAGLVERERIDKICRALATLRPLIPLSVLSAMSGIEQEAIKSFAYDLTWPLLVAGETIQFRDEPAETWFREKFRSPPAEMRGFIDSLRPLASGSAFVAAVLPQLMLEAGQFSELVNMALGSTELPETSPLEKRDVELQRFQFALKATLRTGRYLDATKLALKAGGETAGDERQNKLLQANTDLAALFIETERVQEIVSRRIFGSKWIGSHNAYEAALLSAKTELVGDARSRLRMAYEWLRNWSRLPPGEREKEPVTERDVAALAMAQLNIHGAGSAADALRHWRPRTFASDAAALLAHTLVDHGRFDELNEIAEAAGNDLCLVLPIVQALHAVQKRLPAQIVRRAVQLISLSRIDLRKRSSASLDHNSLAATMALLETALAETLCTPDQASKILARYLPVEPPREITSRYSGTRSIFIRAYVLRAALEGKSVELNDLAYPALMSELQKPNNHSLSADANQFKEDVGALLPWHQLWVATLLGQVSLDDVSERISKTRDESSKAAQISYRDEFRTSDEIARLWVEILHMKGATGPEFTDLFSIWVDNLKRPLFIPTVNAIAKLAAQTAPTHRMALTFAARAFALSHDARESADAKADGYLDCARAILSISPADAKTYFNRAIEVASRIGDENLARWEAMLDLADHAARSDRPAPSAAYNLARCAELTYEYVVRDKHFDWRGTTKALAALCPASSFAILSRWRDRGFGRAPRLLAVTTKFLVAQGSLDALDALPLIGFRGEWDYLYLLKRALQIANSAAERQFVMERILRYENWQGATVEEWKELKQLAVQYGLSCPDIDVNIAHASQREQLTERSQDSDPSRNSKKDQRDWDAIFVNGDLASTNAVSQAFHLYRKTETPWTFEEFFAEACRRVPPGSEPAFVEAIGSMPEFDLYYFRYFFDAVPKEWGSRPAISEAFARMLKSVCRRFCREISRSRYYAVLPFDLVCGLAGVSNTEVVGEVLKAVGELTEPLDVNRLFSLVGMIALRLTSDEALEGLAFGLSLLNPILQDKDGDGPWNIDKSGPSDITASIAGYIWAGLGAPASILRWESAHVVLELCALNRKSVLTRLFALASEGKGGPFVDARLSFYSLHALQWLMIAGARAATEYPAALAPYGQQIAKYALDNSPHVIMREFSARTTRSLIAAGVVSDDGGLKEKLARINTSSLPILDTRTYERVLRQPEGPESSEDEDRFYFSYDMDRYWFEPLGRIFGLSEKSVQREALSAVRGELSNADSGHPVDERQRRQLYDYRQTSHSHGGYPRVDDLQFYLSYHAMMITAGKFLASESVHRDHEYGEEDEFRSWIQRHDISRADGRWLADRRDAPPLEIPKWREREKSSEEKAVVIEDDFDEILQSGDLFNVWGFWTTADDRRVQSAHVRSALVSRDKSMALLRALQTAKDVFDYGLPSADDEQLEIDEPGFRLKGWVSDHSKDRGIDGRDYWCGDVRFPPPAPAPFVVDLMELSGDLDLRVWKNTSGGVAMISRAWGHFELGEEHEETNPESGSRLQAPVRFIQDMLGKSGYDLIVEVQISRRRRHRRYEREKEEDYERVKNQARLYLIRSDGTLQKL